MAEINKTLVEAFNMYKPMPTNYITVTTEIAPSTSMETLAKEVEADALRLAPYEEYPALKELSGAKILKYFSTLVFLRTCYCVNDTSRTKQYKSVVRNLYIPVLFYQILIAIGIADDREQGIRFQPSYSINGEDLLGVQELEDISRAFASMSDLGVASVKGMPNEREGELGFMATARIEQEWRSYRMDHPTNAFLASFLERQAWYQAIGMSLRICYGRQDDFERQISAVYRLMSKPARQDVGKH